MYARACEKSFGVCVNVEQLMTDVIPHKKTRLEM